MGYLLARPCVIILAFLMCMVAGLARPATAKSPDGQDYPESFDFKGIKLGITPADFKLLPIPKEAMPYIGAAPPGLVQKIASVKSECSSDIVAVKTIYPADKNLGVVECAWVVTEKEYAEHRYVSNLSVGNRGSQTYKFRFIAMPGEPNPRLFSIQIFVDSRAFSDISDLLTKKFGAPLGLADSEVQSGSGPIFQNRSMTWRNRSGSVVFTQRVGDVDTSLLQYSLTDYEKYFAELVRAKKALDGPQI